MYLTLYFVDLQPLTCFRCGKYNGWKKNLSYDMKLFKGSIDLAEYKCDLCPYKWPKQSNFIQHLKIAHGIEPRNYNTKMKILINKNSMSSVHVINLVCSCELSNSN